VVLGRYEKAGRLAKQLAGQLNLKSYYFEKRRIGEREVEYRGCLMRKVGMFDCG